MTNFAPFVAAALVMAGLTSAAAQSRTGTFEGASDHETSGSVTVEAGEDGSIVSFGEDFSFDGAPDPRVAFGDAQSYSEGTLVAPLQSDAGAQTYTVPDGIDASQYSHVYLWCERFSVPLGRAALN